MFKILWKFQNFPHSIHGEILKHSGSIPRNACVACETAMRDCDYWTDTRTDRQTDGQTGTEQWSLCATMLGRWHKNTQMDGGTYRRRWRDRKTPDQVIPMCRYACKRPKNQLSEIYGKESREFESVATGGIYPIKSLINQDGNPGLWFVLYLVCVFGVIFQQRWPPWPLICYMQMLCVLTVYHVHVYRFHIPYLHAHLCAVMTLKFC